MANVYPILITPVPSQYILDVGTTIMTPFNPVLTSEVEITPDMSDDEDAPRVSYKEKQISFGLTPYGAYFATLGNVFDLATFFQDHTTPLFLDTLHNREVGINNMEPQSATVLLAARDAALAVGLEVFKLPEDWSATVHLHPRLVACGLIAAPLTLPMGFSGQIRLPVQNLNPKLPVRLYRGQGFYSVSFFQHHTRFPRLNLPSEGESAFVPSGPDLEEPASRREH